MGQTERHHHSHKEDEREEIIARATQLLPYLDAPLIQEAFDPPVRLTKEAEKGEAVLYAVGRGDSGIIVQSRHGSVVSAPRSLNSLIKHQPYLMETLDLEVLASLNF